MNFDERPLDDHSLALLNQYGFDSIPFFELVQRLKTGRLSAEANRLKGPIQLPGEETYVCLPEPGSRRAKELAALGQAAIDARQVGVIVLNGGMATRFGSLAKGVTEAVEGRSFLDLKLSQVAHAGQGCVPVLLMNSFATDEPTRKHLTRLENSCQIRSFSQMISLRCTPSGDLYFDENGDPSFYAPGHGDLPYALQRSGAIEDFISHGGRWLTVSNVDNLGASLDPRVIGLHIEKGAPMTVEIVRAKQQDVGGFPAIVDGKMMIVEAFRAPGSFDVNTIPVFNTNTFVFDAQALRSRFDLDWFAAFKKVNGESVVQFERLVGQLTQFMPVTWLLVPRRGTYSRFIPIKVPADLEYRKQELEQMLAAQGVL
ncbi:MAG: UTP--glucose-1-phosphate uridylyltransferase [Xanthomonadales bacterium]|nr:UTP--glucose-1-phosphate uridylyltransferase [Xanthomonadales bacterium]